jgi:hypothetical protein
MIGRWLVQSGRTAIIIQHRGSSDEVATPDLAYTVEVSLRLTPACVPISILRPVDARRPAASLADSLRSANPDGARSIRTGGCHVKRFRRQTLPVLQLSGGGRTGKGVVLGLSALPAMRRGVASGSNQRQPRLFEFNRPAHADRATLKKLRTNRWRSQAHVRTVSRHATRSPPCVAWSHRRTVLVL